MTHERSPLTGRTLDPRFEHVIKDGPTITRLVHAFLYQGTRDRVEARFTIVRYGKEQDLTGRVSGIKGDFRDTQHQVVTIWFTPDANSTADMEPWELAYRPLSKIGVATNVWARTHYSEVAP